jgi:DNA-binding response OmpR family regulator
LPAPRAGAKIAGVLVLLVDDEPRIARAMEFALLGTDFRMEALSDPNLLEAQIEASRPDVILLDIALGRENGLEVCRKLKADDRFKDIPVLLLSGQTDARTQEAGFNAGADDFVPKPFVPTELLARIRQRLARHA